MRAITADGIRSRLQHIGSRGHSGRARARTLPLFQNRGERTTGPFPIVAVIGAGHGNEQAIVQFQRQCTQDSCTHGGQREHGGG